jgi:hypothetical protein
MCSNMYAKINGVSPCHEGKVEHNKCQFILFNTDTSYLLSPEFGRLDNGPRRLKLEKARPWERLCM